MSRVDPAPRSRGASPLATGFARLLLLWLAIGVAAYFVGTRVLAPLLVRSAGLESYRVVTGPAAEPTVTKAPVAPKESSVQVDSAEHAAAHGAAHSGSEQTSAKADGSASGIAPDDRALARKHHRRHHKHGDNRTEPSTETEQPTADHAHSEVASDGQGDQPAAPRRSRHHRRPAPTEGERPKPASHDTGADRGTPIDPDNSGHGQ